MSRDSSITVLQILPSFDVGGAEVGTISIAQALIEHGARALVISNGGRLTPKLEATGAGHISLPVHSKNPIDIFRNSQKLIQIIKDHKVDLVHARSRAPAWSALRACRKTGTPFVTTVHGAYRNTNMFRRFYSSVMIRSDRTIMISRFVDHHIGKTYRNLNHASVRVIERGINLSHFAPESVTALRQIQLAKVWRLRDGEPVILMPGRISRSKGHEMLFHALKILMADRSFQCLIVGADVDHERYRDSLVRKIKQLGLESCVHVTGPCMDMPAAYMLSDVVVQCPKVAEGFGRVAVEAQAAGRPIVVSDIGALPDVVQHGQTGWVVPSGDAGQLASALGTALDLNAQQRTDLAMRAQAWVKNFSVTKMQQATLSVYAELLRGKKTLAWRL
ncbi:MAG: glycosyltransferase family 4 protein [Pseudomonadota bacterium]